MQFGEALASQFDQIPASRWRALKVVVDNVDLGKVRLERFGADRVCFEEVAQVGDDRL